MIDFNNVSKLYADDSAALEDINLSIKPREFVSFVGPSGAGKTTLIKMLLAEERPSTGSILFDTSDIHSLTKDEMNDIRRRIGVVFQDFRLLPYKNVYENIAFAMEVAGRSDEEIESDVPHVLELVGLDHKIWAFPHELSGGEKQRVAIARAIVNQPDIIVADEPIGNLDPENTFDIVQIFEKINDLGTMVLLTTHNKGVVDSLKKRVVTMEEGRIIGDDAQSGYTI